jgi:hypothetical protein
MLAFVVIAFGKGGACALAFDVIAFGMLAFGRPGSPVAHGSAGGS